MSRIEEHIYKTTPQAELSMWVHRPDPKEFAGSRPGLVLFFGGGWAGGTPEQFFPQAEYFAGRGMVVARADYRVKGRYGNPPQICVQDARSAVRWLRGHADQFRLDPARLAVGGGSAGAHVAMCCTEADLFDAARDDLSVSCRPDAFVLYNPVADCVECAFARERMGDDATARALSPVHNVRGGLPPAILFYGSEDAKFLPGGRAFVEEVRLAEGQGHGFFNASPWLERTIWRTDVFLASLDWLDGPPAVELPEGVEALLAE